MQGCVCTRSHGPLPLTAHVGGPSLGRGPWTHGAWERGSVGGSGLVVQVQLSRRMDMGCEMWDGCMWRKRWRRTCSAERERGRRKRSREAYAGADAASEFLAKTEKSETSEMVCRQLCTANSCTRPGWAARRRAGRRAEQRHRNCEERGGVGMGPHLLVGLSMQQWGASPRRWVGTDGGWMERAKGGCSCRFRRKPDLVSFLLDRVCGARRSSGG